MDDKLKVLIVDDSLIYRKILAAAVDSTGLATASQTASNGVIALERLAQQHFDVVLLDQLMPELTGLETLAVIKDKYPDLAVIMISDCTKENATVTVRALEMGALDFILKPSDASPDRNMEIIKNHLHILFAQVKIKRSTANVTKSLVRDHGRQESEPSKKPAFARDRKKTKLKKVDLTVIATSTGGPVALEQICSLLTPDIKKPILVVQHMPPEFTRVLAESLSRKCLLPVSEGSEGAPVNDGEIVIAPGGYHMVVRGLDDCRRIIRLEETAFVNGVRPAADVLFRSVADTYSGMDILAVILTGMGNDGTAGVNELKQKCNCYCITQSEATCTIYGMPKSICDAGLSDETVDLENIAKRMQQIALVGVNNR
jgi:two-component system chemotaxis response regulator CheB